MAPRHDLVLRACSRRRSAGDRRRGPDGPRIKSFRAEARGGMVGKVMVQAPWEGRFSNYQARGGMLVPLAGEVSWMRPQGRKVYFKGAVARLAHDFWP
jgi:hypothetical protein